MSIWVGLLLVLSGIAVVVVYRLLDRWNNSEDLIEFPYIKRATLYNRAERKFLGYLVKAVGDRYFIMGKVRVADIITIEARLSEKKRRDAYQNICHERVDFVLTDRTTTRLVATIELYQNKPNDTRMMKRAQNLDKVFKLAGLPLIRFQENDIYRVADIRHAVASAVAAVSEQMNERLNRQIISRSNIPSANKIITAPLQAEEHHETVIA